MSENDLLAAYLDTRIQAGADLDALADAITNAIAVVDEDGMGLSLFTGVDCEPEQEATVH